MIIFQCFIFVFDQWEKVNIGRKKNPKDGTEEFVKFHDSP